MHVETLRTGTVGQLAGVRVGAANVWVRPEHGPAVSVELALPADERRLLSVGEAMEVAESFCLLEQIEALESSGAYRLHFLVEPLGSSTAAATTARCTLSLGDHRCGPHEQASRLRAASTALLTVLDVDVGRAAGDGDEAWEHTQREVWIEIDRAPCGPSTHERWVSNAAGGAEAEVALEIVRWNPHDVHETRVRGHWSDGARHLHVHLTGEGDAHAHEVHLSGPRSCIDAVAAVLRAHLVV